MTFFYHWIKTNRVMNFYKLLKNKKILIKNNQSFLELQKFYF